MLTGQDSWIELGPDPFPTAACLNSRPKPRTVSTQFDRLIPSLSTMGPGDPESPRVFRVKLPPRPIEQHDIADLDLQEPLVRRPHMQTPRGFDREAVPEVGPEFAEGWEPPTASATAVAIGPACDADSCGGKAAVAALADATRLPSLAMSANKARRRALARLTERCSSVDGGHSLSSAEVTSSR